MCHQEIQEDAMKCDISIDHPMVNAERVAKIISKHCTNKNINAFYAESQVPKTNAWFSNLEDATVVQIAMQFSENMVHYTHKPLSSEVAETKRAMTSRKIHCIAYIGNYMIRNLYFLNFISFIYH